MKKRKKSLIEILATILLSLFAITVAIAMVAGVFCLISWLFMLLWNGVMVEVFKLPILTFGQCVGIMLLLDLVGFFFRGRGGSRE